MKNIVDRYISEKGEKGIISEWFELGFSEREIEQFIIETHDPYLKNKTIPRVQVHAYMSQYIDSLLHILSNEETKSLFERCLETYWNAKEKNPTLCYKSYQYWEDDVLEATSKLVSLINNDPDRSKMDLHDFVEDVFTKIGKLIEKIIQPHLKIILYLRKVINDETPTALDLDKLSLGTLIDELLKCEVFDKLLKPGSWDIKLNQWRNIANHDNFSVEGIKITGKYGRPPKEKEIVIFQAELWMLFLKMNDLFSLLRLANSLFFLDNMDEIKPFWENKQLRQESSLLDLIRVYEMQGFSVTACSIQNDAVELKVKDLATKESEKRLIKLLSLIRPTWYKTRKRYVKIEYSDFNGNPISILEADTSKRQDLFTVGVDENLLTLENLMECLVLTHLDSAI